MTLRRPPILPLAAIAASFALALVVFGLLSRSSAPAPAPSPASAAGSIPRTTDARIAGLQAAIRAEPGKAGSYALLADAYLQKVRESGDASFYARAQGALAEGRRRDSREPGIETGLGTLALARHDFAGGLRHGLAALRLAPDSVRPLGVIVDAQVELGRYPAAERTIQRMVDLKPSMASYARVSYFRELTGDLPGAVQAMRLAVDAGGDAPENVSYLQALLGGLELQRGRLGPAREAYRHALDSVPGYAPAEAGLARLAAAQGDLAGAIRRLRPLVARLPLPEYAIQLGETELAAGRRAGGRRDLAVVDVERRLLQSAGVNVDTEIATFEADHGSPARAVELARRAYASAPSVRSADALGWALTSAGHPQEGLAYAHRALRLGSRDGLLLFHAGMSARAAGRGAEARGYLRRALAGGLRFSPFHAPQARRALGGDPPQARRALGGTG
jgi:tetratricopeptide (TPR) repeat protein